jgi:hypothetical protein
VVLDAFSTDPLSGSGHLLAVSGQMDTLPTWLAFVPGLSSLSLSNDGPAVALPAQALGLPPSLQGHVALRGERLMVAIGDGSATRAVAPPQAAPPERSPLLLLDYDIVEFMKLMPQALAQTSFGAVKRTSVAFDIAEQGLEMKMLMTW